MKILVIFKDMARITIDLHDIYNKGRKIDDALESLMVDAEDKGIREIEIIHGKGSGQLKKRTLRFLGRKDIKRRCHRIKKDPNNFGRVFVYLKRTPGS